MRSIKFRGEEAVLVQEVSTKDYVFLTFLQRQQFGMTMIRLDYDATFNILETKEFSITHSELDAIEAFRKNHIDAEEFAERIQLAQ